MATTSPVCLFTPLETDPYVPSPSVFVSWYLFMFVQYTWPETTSRIKKKTEWKLMRLVGWRPREAPFWKRKMSLLPNSHSSVLEYHKLLKVPTLFRSTTTQRSILFGYEIIPLDLAILPRSMDDAMVAHSPLLNVLSCLTLCWWNSCCFSSL